jgi:hypothetical protein
LALIRRLPYLLACAASVYLNNMRFAAVGQLCAAGAATYDPRGEAAPEGQAAPEAVPLAWLQQVRAPPPASKPHFHPLLGGGGVAEAPAQR